MKSQYFLSRFIAEIIFYKRKTIFSFLCGTVQTPLKNKPVMRSAQQKNNFSIFFIVKNIL